MATGQKMPAAKGLAICTQTPPKHLIQYGHTQENERVFLFPAFLLDYIHTYTNIHKHTTDVDCLTLSFDYLLFGVLLKTFTGIVD